MAGRTTSAARGQLDLFIRPAPRPPQTEVKDVKLKYLDPDKIELRPYQEALLRQILLGGNFGVVMDTSLGKTFLAFLAMDYALRRGKVLFCAPSRPLCDQHYRGILESFKLAPEEAVILSGKMPARKRSRHYQNTRVVVATPQTVKNDILARRCGLEGFSLIVLDEFHHTGERYAYRTLADQANERGIQILALSASPGGSRAEIEMVKGLLHLDYWLTPDAGAQLFQFPCQQTARWIPLGDELTEILASLEKTLISFWAELARHGLVSGRFHFPPQKELDQLKIRVDQARGNDRFAAISHYASFFQLLWAYKYLLMEGEDCCLNYLSRLSQRQSRAAERIFENSFFKRAYRLIRALPNDRFIHPKRLELLRIAERAVGEGKVIMVFVRYCDSNEAVRDFLERECGRRAESLMGQKRMSQRRQQAVVEGFKRGEFPILVVTSIGQEGLHLPSVDLAIEYSPSWNGIEVIQRAGRVGRNKPGQIISLVMDHPIEKAFFYASRRKVGTMKQVVSMGL